MQSKQLNNLFKRYQWLLLWLCNSFLTRFPFRWILRTDLKWHKDIIELYPHYYAWREGAYIKRDFRGNNKFARRLYFAFKPLWWLLHFWDWLTSPVPRWNLGFDTTPNLFPDAGSGGTTCDGEVQYSAAGDGDVSW